MRNWSLINLKVLLKFVSTNGRKQYPEDADPLEYKKRFKSSFLNRFFTHEKRGTKFIEFINLLQGKMSVK